MAGKNARRVTGPGAALKDLRVKHGLTLADLSDRTGIPVSSVSKMENGKTALTFDKLLKFSEALDVDLASLLAGAAVDVPQHDGAKRRSISRAGDGEAVETPRGNYLYLASELLHKQFVPIIGDVLARDIDLYGEYSQHDGEEFVHVLEGELHLYTETYTPAVLKRGDSVYFDSGMRHAYIAGGDEPCRIMSICASPDPYFLSGANEPAAVLKPKAATTTNRRGPRRAPAPV